LKGMETNLINDTTSFSESINSESQSEIENTKSDIFNPIAALSCLNQTQCIKPVLQLKEHFNVYYCKHVGHGVRFYFLVSNASLSLVSFILVCHL